ncbi:hypothetical protein [Herbidospora cretacea]|uniref:hypothetical protein n=1 Tax=Herbidospora cretacea TaxID=28444 RepID=UPI001E48ACB5|nr:hypothetical protein [Herbidospora cretacea]
MWRNDARPPSVINEEGFQPWERSEDFAFHLRGILAFTEKRWVYAIRNPGGGSDVSKTLGWRYKLFGFGSENEIVFRGGVGPDEVMHGRPVWWGKYIGD